MHPSSIVVASSFFAVTTLVTPFATAQTPTSPPNEPAAGSAPVYAPATSSTSPPPVVSSPAASNTSSGPSAYADGSTEPPAAEEHSSTPKARSGFQVALRAGIAIPMGDAAKDVKLTDFAGPQFASTIDIGAKVIPQLFLGAYVGSGFGGAGDTMGKLCDRVNASCLAVSYRIGVEAQVHILPASKVDPWVGYGIGYEVTQVAGKGNGTDYSQTAVGPDYGHLLAGVDVRLTKIFGIGPFVDFSFGQYSNIDVSPGGGSGEVKDKAMHQWLTLGAKFLFFP